MMIRKKKLDAFKDHISKNPKSKKSSDEILKEIDKERSQPKRKK